MNLQPEDIELRTRLALVLIHNFMQDRDNQSHRAPTHDELIDLLNAQLPPRQIKRRIVPAIVSKQQTARFAEHLRQAGLMITAPGEVYNMRPTPLGERFVQQWSREALRWAREERRVWEQHGTKGATQKSAEPSVRSAV